MIRAHKCPPSCHSPASVSAEFRLTVAVTESVAVFVPSKSEVYSHKLMLARGFVGPVGLNKEQGRQQRSLPTGVLCGTGLWGVIFQIKKPKVVILVGFERV